MFDFLRRLFRTKRPNAHLHQDSLERVPRTSLDPELQQKMAEIDQKYNDLLQRERAAEARLTPKELIKKRMKLPEELPADYQADRTVSVLSPTGLNPDVLISSFALFR